MIINELLPKKNCEFFVTSTFGMEIMENTNAENTLITAVYS